MGVRAGPVAEFVAAAAVPGLGVGQAARKPVGRAELDVIIAGAGVLPDRAGRAAQSRRILPGHAIGIDYGPPPAS